MVVLNVCHANKMRINGPHMPLLVSADHKLMRDAPQFVEDGLSYKFQFCRLCGCLYLGVSKATPEEIASEESESRG